jgi:hypothetical protein
VNYDDETLMAYADGELDEARRAEISAAVEKDPELARRVAAHRALRAQVAGAFATVTEQPVPDRLRAAARAPLDAMTARESRPRGNVVQFPARGSSGPRTPWRAREWTAMAASLVLGGLIGWQFMSRSAGDFGTERGVVVARGGLATALDTQLASEQADDASVRIGLSFRASDGAYCRSFVSSASSMAGLACKAGPQWRIEVVNAVEAGGPIRQAATLPPAVLQAIEARGGSEALDASAEKAARDAGWIQPSGS